MTAVKNVRASRVNANVSGAPNRAVATDVVVGALGGELRDE